MSHDTSLLHYVYLLFSDADSKISLQIAPWFYFSTSPALSLNVCLFCILKRQEIKFKRWPNEGRTLLDVEWSCEMTFSPTRMLNRTVALFKIWSWKLQKEWNAPKWFSLVWCNERFLYSMNQSERNCWNLCWS